MNMNEENKLTGSAIPDEYPFMIQFTTMGLMSQSTGINTTIDLTNIRVIFSQPDSREEETVSNVCTMDEEALSELRRIVPLKALREFEALSAEELVQYECGYRDEGSYVQYSYFDRAFGITSGKMQRVYSNSPFEDVLEWIARWYPINPIGNTIMPGGHLTKCPKCGAQLYIKMFRDYCGYVVTCATPNCYRDVCRGI